MTETETQYVWLLTSYTILCAVLITAYIVEQFSNGDNDFFQ